MNDDFRHRANRVRNVLLKDVLLLRSAVQDPRDRAKWHTERGELSVTGIRFMNWTLDQGGGGAIDLVMHLAEFGYRTAVEWLERYAVPPTLSPVTADPLGTSPTMEVPARLPPRDERMLDRVRDYLTRRRHLSAEVLQPLFESGRCYADCRSNAVFVMMRGKPNRPVGAELRGTGPQVWRGIARGSRKDLGYFWIGIPESRDLVLCESAIDAISCFQLRRDCICVSTAGVRANPRWLPNLIARGFNIHCGFDADNPGDLAAFRMIRLHPTLRRLRPEAHDWNDLLASRT